MNETQWNIPPGDPVIPGALLEAGCSPLLAAVLQVRGLTTAEEAAEYLDGGSELLADPLLMADMAAAAARLNRAIENGEHVAVYGDYDVDGITSSCMLTDYLRSRGLECELYIPDRIEEGYGVNAGAVRLLRDKGVTLIVTVDCGITAIEETALAAEYGMEVLITDHHECREQLPGAVAVVDPKRPDCGYPGAELAGVGVAFKLICVLEGSAERTLRRYADLVAVGTVADVMPLLGENRYIVKEGLRKLEEAPRPGLRALIEEAGQREKKITASSVGFSLAPRLNASGRLGQVESAVRLLLTGEAAEAALRASELCRMNRDRQTLETEIWRQALEMIGDTPPDGPIVLARENWHQGVIGIAASRLTEAFGVPAIMICLDGDKGKGSCRSCAGFNLFEALSGCADYLEGFGGHALAAGLTIRRERVPAFRNAIAAYYREHPPAGLPALDIDLRINGPELLCMECVEDLERMEPCGAGNPRALLCMTGVRILELTPIGGGKHLRVRLERWGQIFDAVWFSQSGENLSLRAGDWADVAFHPQINVFRAHRSVQLLICALRPHASPEAVRVLAGDISGLLGGAVPQREDCVVVWRALSSAGGRCCDAPAGLTETLNPRMPEEQVCLILKIFEELGLLSVSGLAAGVYDVRTIPAAPKADLNNSRLLQAMRENAAEKERP